MLNGRQTPRQVFRMLDGHSETGVRAVMTCMGGDMVAARLRADWSAARFLALGTALSLAACVSSEEQRTIDMANDKQRCEQLGFEPGTQAMAMCMANSSVSRSAEADRQAAENREWQRKRDENFRRMQEKSARKPEQKCKIVEKVTTQEDGTVVTDRENVCTSF